MRYRTAAISCFALIGVMFGYPQIMWAVFLPSLKNGPSPLPAYDRFFLDIAVFCMEWRFILVLPVAIRAAIHNRGTYSVAGTPGKACTRFPFPSR